MASKLERFLSVTEHVDHIDNDKTNDDLSNLQILTPLENHHKEHLGKKVFIDFICPVCNKEFNLEKRQSHRNNPTCCRACGRIKANITRSNSILNNK